MVTFERLTIDTDFPVWDIFYNGAKVGHITKDKYLYLEVLYDKYKLRLNQNKFVPSIVRLTCVLIDSNAISGTYIPNENLKPLGKRFTRYEDYTIKN